MKVLVFSLLVAMATALPQHFDTHRSFGDNFGSFNTRGNLGSTHTTRVGHSITGFGSSAHGHSAYTNCERREVSPGNYEYDCHNAAPGEILDEKVLWVPYSGSDQNLLIRVPNYAVRDIVRAATYSEGENNENIRVHVARPEVHHVVEGQFEKSVQQAPNVQLSYDPLVQHHEKVYGPPGEPFRPLTKKIDDQVGFRRANSNIHSTFSSVRPVATTGFSSGSGFNSGTGFSSRSGLSGNLDNTWPATSFSTGSSSNRNSNTGFSTGVTRDATATWF
jgi:hypothetical protein